MSASELRNAAGVDQQSLAAGESQKQAVALAHVDRIHLQYIGTNVRRKRVHDLHRVHTSAAVDERPSDPRPEQTDGRQAERETNRSSSQKGASGMRQLGSSAAWKATACRERSRK